MTDEITISTADASSTERTAEALFGKDRIEIDIPLEHAGVKIAELVRVGLLNVMQLTIPTTCAMALWKELGRKLGEDTQGKKQLETVAREQRRETELLQLQLKERETWIAQVQTRRHDAEAKVARLEDRVDELLRYFRPARRGALRRRFKKEDAR